MRFQKNLFLYLPVFSLVFLWAVYGILLRFYDSMGVNAFDVNFWGFLAGSILLFAIFKMQNVRLALPDKNHAKKLLLYSVGLTSTNYFLFTAFTSSTLANTIILHYTAIIWSSIAAVFFFKEKPTKWKAISVLLTVTGITVMFLPEASVSSKYFFGNTAALLSSFGYTALLLASKSMKNEEPKKSSFYSMLFCAVIFAPFFLFFGSAKAFESAAILALIGATYNILEIMLLIYGLAKVSVITANLIFVLEIPTDAVLGAVLYSEPLFAGTALGGLLIITATALAILKEKKTTA